MFLRLLLMGKKTKRAPRKAGKRLEAENQRSRKEGKRRKAEKQRGKETQKQKNTKTQKSRQAEKSRENRKKQGKQRKQRKAEKRRKAEKQRSKEAKSQGKAEKKRSWEQEIQKNFPKRKNKVIPLEHSPPYPSFTYLSFGDHYRRVNRPTDAPTCSSSVQSFCPVGMIGWGFNPPREETHLVVLDHHHHHVWHQPDRYGIIRVYLRLVGLVSTLVNYPSPIFSQIYCSYLLPGAQIQCQH